VSPFDYVLTLLSFVFALAMAHLLMGGARMVRHRRELTFSWPHALWMAAVFIDLVINWLGFWDARALKVIDLATIAGAVVMATLQYLVAALVTPEFETNEDYDLQRFHREQSRTYLGALLAFGVVVLVVNAAADAEGVEWSRQNGIVALMFAPGLAALFLRNRVVQVVAPIAEMALIAWYAVVFYPRIS
jgi:hypothetical protein